MGSSDSSLGSDWSDIGDDWPDASADRFAASSFLEPIIRFNPREPGVEV